MAGATVPPRPPTPDPRHPAIAPAPAPEEVAAILAALHHHRRRALAGQERVGARGAPSRWSLAGRQQALRRDWPARRGVGWRNVLS